MTSQQVRFGPLQGTAGAKRVPSYNLPTLSSPLDLSVVSSLHLYPPDGEKRGGKR